MLLPPGSMKRLRGMWSTCVCVWVCVCVFVFVYFYVGVCVEHLFSLCDSGCSSKASYSFTAVIKILDSHGVYHAALALEPSQHLI